MSVIDEAKKWLEGNDNSFNTVEGVVEELLKELEKCDAVIEAGEKYILSLRQLLYAPELGVRANADMRINKESPNYTKALRDKEK